MKEVAMNQRFKRLRDLAGKNVIMTVVLVSFFLLCVPGVSYANTVQWTFRPVFGEADSSPAVGDLDDDGISDLVLCTTAGRVFALDVNGRQKWFYDTEQTISSAPTISDVKSKEPKVFAITNPGQLVCLDGKSGARFWTYNMPGKFDWGTTVVTAADINQDNRDEIIVADNEGNMVCLDNEGSPLWMRKYQSGFNSAPAIADLDSDGQLEILIGTKKSPLVCFSKNGDERWHWEQDGSVTSSPVVCDLNSDNQPEILVGQGDGISMLNNKGKEIWHYRMKKQIHDAIAVGDIDGDGFAEIIVVDLFGQVVCLDYNGHSKWTANVEQRVRRSPAIADLDGDSVPEIIIGGYSSALHIFDPDGNLKERIPLKRPMNSSPTIIDFRGDHTLSLIAATEADIIAYTWMDSKPMIKPPVLWAEYRANSSRTASVIQAQPKKGIQISDLSYGGLYVGPNDFQVTVMNPEKKHLTLRLEITKNNTKPVISTLTSSDSVFTNKMPYTIIGQSAVNLQFVYKLLVGKKLHTMRERSYYIVPFAKDVADLHQMLAKVKAQTPHLKDQRYVQDRLTIMSDKISNIEKQTKLAGTLPPPERANLVDKMTSLRYEAKRLLAMTQSAAETGKLLAVQVANPWAPFGGIDEIAEGRTAGSDLLIEAFGGETEHAALNLTNFNSRPLTVRIEAEPVMSMKDSSLIPAQRVLSFHEVLNVPTQSLDYSADALPLVGQAQTIMIPAWDVRQLWIDIDVSDLSPGNWQTVLRFRTLEVEPIEVASDLRIQVWRAHLPEQQPLKLCHWGYVHTSVLKDQPEAALRDQVDHGTNVFVATNTFAPKATFDEDGDIIGDIDFSQHDQYVKQHSPHGIILFFNYQSSLRGPAKRFTPPWIKAYKQWLKAWVDHMQEIGVGYEKFAFYPIDEPGLREGLVDDYISYSKPIREVDRRVQIYTDPVAGATLNDLKKMTPYVDIWCPNRNGYLLDKGLEKLKYIKSTRKTIWTYECAANAKHQSPLGYYRAQAWLDWYHGLTGIGFWSYCTSQYDPWYTPVGGSDYLLIYQGEGVISSKRWEAVRDGIEDYSMLMQLKNLLDKAKDRKDIADTIRTAKEFLSKETSTLAQYCSLDKDGTLPGASGLSVVRQVEDVRWKKFIEVRRKLAEYLDVLSN